MQKNNINTETLYLVSNEAVKTITNLWSKSNKTFWRSTVHRARTSEEVSFYPTVSLRCTESLLATMDLFPEWISSGNKKQIFDEIIPRFLELNVEELKSSLNGQSEKKSNLNDFTLALFIQTFSRICKLLVDEKELYEKALIQLKIAVEKLHAHSFLKTNNNVNIIDEHPFILFHVLRAYSLSIKYIDDINTRELIAEIIKKILCNIRDVTEKLLARNELSSLNPSDNIALAFCAASLAQFNISDNSQHLIPALRLSVESQDNLGCWPMGRIVHENKDIEAPRLEISTHEVAWVMALTCWELINDDIIENNKDTVANIMSKLEKSAEYAGKSIVKISEDGIQLSGWCSDQPYNHKMIESWTSANVLQFVGILAQVREKLEIHEVLSSFSFICPRDRDWPEFLRWDTYKQSSEVNHDYPILEYLERKIITPIKNHPQNLPSPENRTVSALLFGPPGTSKTTIVKAVAESLNWPIVLLNPGHFIEGGLESIERLARSVFERLMKLSKVVVLFDECDELFRERAPLKVSEQTRGITAFVTACMLPKLQELHDRGKIVFFICTNNFESIDSAIKRGGRIDHIIGVGAPDRIARKKIIDNTIERLKSQSGFQEPKYLEAAISKLSEDSERFIRSEIVRALNSLMEKAPWSKKEVAIRQAREVISFYKGSLTITTDELSKFEEQNKKFSHILMEKKNHE